MNDDGTPKTNPATGAPYKHTEFMGLAGARWNALDEAGRAKYQALADADRARFAREKEEYDKKGYFTRADGTKSNAGAKKAAKTPAKSPASRANDADDEPVRKSKSQKSQAKSKEKRASKMKTPRLSLGSGSD